MKILIGLILTIALALIFFRPVDTKNLNSRSKPVQTYEQALERIKLLKAKDDSSINPDCRTRMLLHDKKVEKSIVLIHGYTSCPKMYEQLAKKFYDLGYNVLIPRAPHHGLNDRMTEDLKNLFAEEQVYFTDDAIDIAQGLGDKVSVLGLSSGGVLTSWAAQERADIDKAVIIAPSFSNHTLAFFNRTFLNALITLPNIFLWWNPKLKGSGPGPKYPYPRYSTKALGQIYRLGQFVFDTSLKAAPKAQFIVVILNQNDESINNKVAEVLVQNWKTKGAKQIRVFEFKKELRLIHDLISPEHVNQRVDIVYPVLVSQTNDF